jgi:hypothetical protein
VCPHTGVERASSATHDTNDLGFAIEHDGLERIGIDWMLNDGDGIYHPNWGLEVAWSGSGGSVRQVLSDDDGLNVRTNPVLSFRVLQLWDDPLNPSGSDQDLHIRIEDADGRQATVSLSDAPQGALRPNPEVGSGTRNKSVYETYRLPMDLFTSDEPDLDTSRLMTVDWVFDVTDSGALIMDDIVFTNQGHCE